MDTFKEHILVVEDSKVNQKLLQRLLVKTGYVVDVAGDGYQALTFLQAEGRKLPDLIVLDIIMPGMDGFELCRRLKQDASFQDIPVIFISSLDAADDKVRGFEAGGVDYITKPIDPDEMLDIISKWIDKTE